MNINLTLLGQAIAFTIFVLLCMRYVWPPLRGMLDERADKIAAGLSASSQAAVALEEARAESECLLQEARATAAEAVKTAEGRAIRIVAEAKTQAQVEAERQIQAARAEIERAQNRARDNLRKELSDLVVMGTEKVISVELAQLDATAHAEMLEAMARRL